MKILAQDVPTEQEQEVQQGEHDIDEIKYWTPGQMSVVLQKPIEEVPALPIGHRFPYRKGWFEIVDIKDDAFAIKRLGSEMTSELPLTGNPEMDHPYDVFRTPYAENPGHQIEHVLVKPKTGPVEVRVTKPGTQQGQGIVEKVDVLGPELKSPHPPAWRNRNIPETKEPRDLGSALASVPSEEQVAAIMAAEFATCTKPMLMLADQGFDVRAQLEINHAEFQNSVIERFCSLYPDLVHLQLEEYSDMKAFYMRTLPNPNTRGRHVDN